MLAVILSKYSRLFWGCIVLPAVFTIVLFIYWKAIGCEVFCGYVAMQMQQ